jgi:polysaccharide chain length determinant protein (PEP-CTERM system associated)
MLPGKSLTPEDVLQIFRRRIWLLLVPFAIVSALTTAVSRVLPDRYRSETLILVVPQRVPESYVRSTVTTRIEDRLQSISQQILSRTRLERIIQDFNLYANERRTGIMEDVVDGMRKDIVVQVVKGDAFRVTYSGDDPRTVMRVTERLASLFIEENLRDREVLAEGTNQFLEAQLDDARRRLIEQEKKLEAYRKRFSGELPSQLDSNLQALQNAQQQLQTAGDSLNRDRDRRLLIERQLGDLEQLIAASADAERTGDRGGSVDADGTPSGGTAEQQLASARAALSSLETRLKPGHPDIVRLKRLVRDLEKTATAEAPKTNPAEAARQKRRDDLRLELAQLDRQIAAKQADEERLRGAITSLQKRVDIVPTRESEMTELMRDYSTLQTGYATLLTKNEESKIAANLERRQIGEQFKLLDPARVPEKPYSPNRSRINFAGMAGGLALSLMLIAFVEYRDKSFNTDSEVMAVLSLPVLAVVPFMQSHAERRRAAWRRAFVGVGLGATVVGCLAVVAYTFVMLAR